MHPQEAHDGGAGADLDVVAVGPYAEYSQRPFERFRQKQLQHGWPSRFQTAQNGLPLR